MRKIINKNMELVITNEVVIGRSKGPIQAIFHSYEEKIQELKTIVNGSNATKEVIVEESNTKTSVAVWRNHKGLLPYDGEIDMIDYKQFCEWMISEGEVPQGIYDYRLAISYHLDR